MKVLDSDIVIDLWRDFRPARLWFESLGNEEIILPGFAAMELIAGCQNKREQRRVEKILSAYSIAWASFETCQKAFTLFASYHLSHHIGIIDAMIAQMAIELNLPLHTFNQKHYAFVPGLQTIQPYQK